MRFLDLAVALLIGTSALAGMAALAPRQGDLASISLQTVSQLRDTLLALVQQKGTAWLVQTSPEDVCAYLLGISNSSVTFSGEIGSLGCGASPPPGVPFATIALDFFSRPVVLEAWENGQP